MKRVPIQLRIPIVFDKQHCCPYEKPFGYVYLIRNKVNGHFYIGKHEFNKPRLDLSYKGSGVALNSAYLQYGRENFETIILEWTDKDNSKLCEIEKYWIDMYGSYKFPQHYNLTEGGGGISGLVFTEESRKKMSQNHPDMSGDKNPNYGNRWTDEQKRDLSKKLSGHTRSQGTKNAMARAVVQVTLDCRIVRIYDYINEAVPYGFNSTCISECCNNIQMVHKNYRWFYLDEFKIICGIIRDEMKARKQR